MSDDDRRQRASAAIAVAAVALAIVLADQAAKYWAERLLQPGESASSSLPFVRWTLVHNTGAAFGLLQRWTGVFIAVSLATCGVILWILRDGHRARAQGAVSASSRSHLPPMALALILGGAVGNLIDRLRWGYVVDFIDLRVWPVFNLADSAITVGVALLIWRMVGTRDGCSHGC